MELQIETLTVVNKNGTFRIAYDGVVLGDDRGFGSEAAANAEVDRRIAKDAADAVRYDRPVLLKKA